MRPPQCQPGAFGDGADGVLPWGAWWDVCLMLLGRLQRVQGRAGWGSRTLCQHHGSAPAAATPEALLLPGPCGTGCVRAAMLWVLPRNRHGGNLGGGSWPPSSPSTAPGGGGGKPTSRVLRCPSQSLLLSPRATQWGEEGVLVLGCPTGGRTPLWSSNHPHPPQPPRQPPPLPAHRPHTLHGFTKHIG